MKTLKFNIKVFAFAFIVHASFAKAQNGTMSAGGDANGSGGSVAFSVGQVVYTTATDNTITVTQGVQQPYETSIVIDNSIKHHLSFELNIFPNPTYEVLSLNLDFPGNTSESLSYQLIDENGKMLESKNAVAGLSTITLAPYARGIYFIKLMDGKSEIKTYKIIKT